MQFVIELVKSIDAAKVRQMEQFGRINVRVVINRAAFKLLLDLFPELGDRPYLGQAPAGEFGIIDGVPLWACAGDHWFNPEPMAAVVDEHAHLEDFLRGGD